MAELAQMESGEFAEEEIADFSEEEFEAMVEDYEDDGDYLYQGADDEYPEEFDPDLEYKSALEDVE